MKEHTPVRTAQHNIHQVPRHGRLLPVANRRIWSPKCTWPTVRCDTTVMMCDIVFAELPLRVSNRVGLTRFEALRAPITSGDDDDDAGRAALLAAGGRFLTAHVSEVSCRSTEGVAVFVRRKPRRKRLNVDIMCFGEMNIHDVFWMLFDVSE